MKTLLLMLLSGNLSKDNKQEISNTEISKTIDILRAESKRGDQKSRELLIKLNKESSENKNLTDKRILEILTFKNLID